ncbi:hypothetical protein B0H34DRAFT_723246 [Crassisporium funariophilum]|nr:hypothetical protein B0H34DRAFT_723246 [Crassisporium funariophilum]
MDIPETTDWSDTRSISLEDLTSTSATVSDPRMDVLSNPDIMSLIFDHLAGDQSLIDSTPRSSLLNVIKTCTIFMEPALDTLWKTLPSLLPLLLLLPSFILVDNVYMLEDVVDSDWERFDVHARRVRTIYMEPLPSSISQDVYLQIQRIRSTHLLPALRELRIPDNSSIHLSSTFLLPTEHLKMIELNNNAISNSQFIRQFLPSLSVTSPNLTHLILRGTATISLDLITRFTRLRTLEIQLSGTYLYPQNMEDLGNLEDLVELTLDVGPVNPTLAPIRTRRQQTSNEDNVAVPPRKFHQVRRLRLIGTPMSMSRVLDHMELKMLETVVIDEVQDQSGSQPGNFWLRCFERLSASHFVTSIEINQAPQRTRGHDQNSLDLAWISPLFVLSRVERLAITGGSLTGSDGSYRNLTKAFPALRTFIIPPAHHSHGMTLRSLSYFSQNCPNLQELKVCFGYNIAQNITALKDTQVSPRHHHALRNISVASQFGSFPVAQMVEVAQFLVCAFPNLTAIKQYYGFPEHRPDPSVGQVTGCHNMASTYFKLRWAWAATLVNVSRKTRRREDATIH